MLKVKMVKFMKIFTSTNKPAHVTALKVVPQPLKLLGKSLKLKKPNTRARFGREIYFSVGESQLPCCEHSLFLVGINPSVLSHLWCIQPHIDLIIKHSHTVALNKKFP